MLTKIQLELLACPICKSKLEQKRNKLECSSCGKKYGYKDGFPVLLPNITSDVELSMNKWNELYDGKLKTKDYLKDMDDYQKNHQPKIVEQVDKTKRLGKGSVYLEIGCGPGYLGLHYGKKGAMIVGIDFSTSALKIAEELAKKYKIKNRLFICGDITQMPFAKGSIDLVYGGGTIEHFKDTNVVVEEIYRILKKGGVSFNTVPCLNIGTLYRLRWGNIPNIVVIRQIFEFINLNLLGGKHMTFGYELSFLASTLRNIHKRAGFKRIKVDRFDTHLVLESVPEWSSKIFANLCENNPLFWPMFKAVARK